MNTLIASMFALTLLGVTAASVAIVGGLIGGIGVRVSSRGQAYDHHRHRPIRRHR